MLCHGDDHNLIRFNYNFGFTDFKTVPTFTAPSMPTFTCRRNIFTFLYSNEQSFLVLEMVTRVDSILNILCLEKRNCKL